MKRAASRLAPPGYQGGWCVYYTPPQERSSEAGDRCAVGISAKRWADVPFAQRPCFLTDAGESKPGAVACECIRRPTPAEIEARAKWSTTRIARVLTACAAALAWFEANPGVRGCVTECPNCKGYLHASAAPNGHTRGWCETEDCASWVQ